jgi:uncharacterized protein YecE (DUF72 family)
VPRIPINEYQRQVAPGGVGVTPHATATPVSGIEGAALQGFGNALHGTENVVAAYAQKFKRDDDQAHADDAYVTQFGPQFRDLYQNYYNLQGKDALDQRPDYEKRMVELRSSVREGLQNDDQKKLFDGATRGRMEAELDSMARHAAQERRVWMAQTHTATLENLSSTAADKHNDDQAFEGALRSGLAEIDRFGTSRGASAESMRAEGSAFIGRAWTQRIDRAMVDDALGANDMYRAHESLIPPEAREVIERKLKAAVLPVQARIIADHIMTGAPIDSAVTAVRNGDGKMLKVADTQEPIAVDAPTKVKDTRAAAASWVATADSLSRRLYPENPLFADMVTSVIKGRVANVAAAQEAIQKQAQETIFGTMNRTGAVSVDAVLRDPAARDAWTRLDEQTKHAFITRLKGDADGDSLKSNPTAVLDWFRRIHADDSDPTKIRNRSEIAGVLGHGASKADYLFLTNEFDRAQTPEGNTFLKQKASTVTTARRMLHGSIVGVHRLPRGRLAELGDGPRRAGAHPRSRSPRTRPGTAGSRLRSATMAGDAPAMVAGFAGGAVAGGAAGTAVPVVGNAVGATVGGFAGAGALPAGLRSAMMEMYEKGDVTSSSDFIERALHVAWETGKGGLIGAATGGAGVVAKGALPVAMPALARGASVTAAEVGALATVGKGSKASCPSRRTSSTRPCCWAA